MFEELSPEQIQAARAALAKPLHGSPNTSTKRVFNLDVSVYILSPFDDSSLTSLQIAKLLYVISLSCFALLLTLFPDYNALHSCTSARLHLSMTHSRHPRVTIPTAIPTTANPPTSTSQNLAPCYLPSSVRMLHSKSTPSFTPTQKKTCSQRLPRASACATTPCPS